VKYLKTLQELSDTLLDVVNQIEGDFSERNIKLGFQSFFRKLLKQKEPTSEFSLLGFYLIEKFDVFFLYIIEQKELRKLVEYAYSLLIKK